MGPGIGGSPGGAIACMTIEPPPNPYDTESVCSSGDYWAEDDGEGPQMRPGNACLACHRQNGGPNFTIAGTVYPTAQVEAGRRSGPVSGSRRTEADQANADGARVRGPNRVASSRASGTRRVRRLPPHVDGRASVHTT